MFNQDKTKATQWFNLAVISARFPKITYLDLVLIALHGILLSQDTQNSGTLMLAAQLYDEDAGSNKLPYVW